MIINGIAVEGAPKKVKLPIKGQEVELTMAYINEDEKIDVEFKWMKAPEGMEIISKKLGNRVATTIIKNGVVIFENLTAQSVFQVLGTAFNWTVGQCDGVYKKSNPLRKEYKLDKIEQLILTDGAI